MLLSLLVLSQIKNSIEYEEVGIDIIHNIIAMSTVGVGKSTLMNKFAEEKKFTAGQNVIRVTKEVSSQKVLDS